MTLILLQRSLLCNVQQHSVEPLIAPLSRKNSEQHKLRTRHQRQNKKRDTHTTHTTSDKTEIRTAVLGKASASAMSAVSFKIEYKQLRHHCHARSAVAFHHTYLILISYLSHNFLIRISYLSHLCHSSTTLIHFVTIRTFGSLFAR